MEGIFFNIDSGYPEALVRGYRSGLITQAQYANMTQCDSLEDLKLQLSATDYGNFLANVPGPLSTSDFGEKMQARVVKDFSEIQRLAVEPLSTFLDYITYGYMIDNIILLISGPTHNRDKDEMLARCHPLGWFPTLPALSVATDAASLYDIVLVDTPLASYFRDCISVEELTDLNIEIIRNRLYKAYLEDFNKFCSTLGQPSSEIMQRMLAFEADRRTVNIAFNSVGTSLTKSERRSLMPDIGNLAPVAGEQLARSDDPEQIRSIIESYGGPQFSQIFDNSSGSSAEDHLYRIEMELCRGAFTQQFAYSTFYAWLKAAEQEMRNISWISECIAQNQRSKIGNYITVL